MPPTLYVAPSIFDPLDYEAAVTMVLSDPQVRSCLRTRIGEDSSADPVHAHADAEVLLELAKVRLREAQARTIGNDSRR